ncbi:MAG TPA: VWA domain-containing protein [Thermoanaerobaculia bacterium]|nr:VWA domain-containing protein [Thermoanaerobaculia bacterium]
MRHMLVTVILLAAASATFASRVEIILDVSGSMAAAAGDRSRMEVAREAVAATVAAIPSESIVALRLYGHRIDKDDRAASCRDTELVIPFGPVDPARFAAVVDAAAPRGQTPLAHSLERAAEDLSEHDEPGAVVLVSDGEESCGRDPREVACRLAADGLPLTVHTVGFAVDAAARRQLEAIAACTGGEYRDAGDAASLAGSLQDLVQASLVLDRERQAVGSEVRGGDGFDTAVELSPGALHRLDHHQKRGQEDYFAVEVAAGQKLVASMQSHEAGIAITGDRAREQEHSSCAGIAVHGPDRQRIGSRWGHQPGQQVGVEVPVSDGQGGRFFVLVGPMTCPGDQHQDSRFQVELFDQFDAGSGTDAGDSRLKAAPIEAGEHRGWLHANDESDYLRFDAGEGPAYGVTLTPEQPDKHLQLTVYDRDGNELAAAGHALDQPGTTLRLEGLRPPAGAAFVEVATHRIGKFESGKLESAYSLVLTETPVAAESSTASEAEDPETEARSDSDPTPVERQETEDPASPLPTPVLWAVVGAAIGGLLLVSGAVAVRILRR